MLRKLWMVAILLSAMLTTLASSGAEPRWSRTYGATGSSEDRIRAIASAGSGAYFVGGYSVPGATDYDFWLVKTLASGAVDWSYGYGSANADYMTSVANTSDGGAVMAGYTTGWGAGGEDILVIKVDSSGTVQWAKTYGGTDDERAYAIRQITGGGYILVGETTSFGTGVGWGSPPEDGWALELDSAGAVVWEKTYGNAWSTVHIETFRAVTEDQDGNFAVTGYARSYGAGAEWLWVLKLSGTDGSILWRKVTEWNGNGNSIECTPDNGFIVGGDTISAGLDYVLCLIRLDSSGGVTWQKEFSGNEKWTRGGEVVQTSDGGFVLGGTTEGYGAGLSDAWALKTDASGNLLWQHAYGGTAYDTLYGVAASPDGGCAMAVQTNSLGWAYDYWVLRAGDDGHISSGCNFTLDTNAPAVNSAYTWFNLNPLYPTVMTSTATVTSVTPVRTATTPSTAEQCGVHGPYLSRQSHVMVDNGNGDGIADPGETLTLTVTAKNTGVLDSSVNTGVLSTVTPGISITQNGSAYPDLAVGASGTNSTAYTFTVAPTVACGTAILFNLHFAGQDPGTTPFQNDDPFQVTVGSLGAPQFLLNEDFNAGLPVTWTVVDGGGSTSTWAANDPCGRALFSTPYMIADTWCAGSVAFDEQLLTPVVDCSSAVGVTLYFDNSYTYYYDTADVDVRSSLTGGIWQNVVQWTATDSGARSFDLTSNAAGASDVQVRWHMYNAYNGYYWGIDNVRIEAVTAPVCNPLPQRPAEVCKSGAATPLGFTDKTTLTWEDKTVPGADTFNLYRGDVANLASGYGSCLASGLTASTASDAQNPSAGVCWFYLVTGKNAVGEGTMGFKTGGQERANGSPCP